MNIFRWFTLVILGLTMACKTPVKIDKSQAIGSETDSMIRITGITHSFLVDLLKQHPDHFKAVLANPEYKVQIIIVKLTGGKMESLNSQTIILILAIHL